MLQSSATRISEPDDEVSEMVCGYKSHWEDCSHGRHAQRFSQTEKKNRTNHESSKEANLIGNTVAINQQRTTSFFFQIRQNNWLYSLLEILFDCR